MVNTKRLMGRTLSVLSVEKTSSTSFILPLKMLPEVELVPHRSRLWRRLFVEMCHVHPLLTHPFQENQMLMITVKLRQMAWLLQMAFL